MKYLYIEGNAVWQSNDEPSAKQLALIKRNLISVFVHDPVHGFREIDSDGDLIEVQTMNGAGNEVRMRTYG